MRVYFTNLGCKLNQAEIERFARDFQAAGHQVAESLAEADLHVVNSCTVTHTAARSSRKAAGRGRSSGLRTVLTGCYASDPTAAAHLAGVDLVVPNAEKDRLLERVHAAFPDAVPASPDSPGRWPPPPSPPPCVPHTPTPNGRGAPPPNSKNNREDRKLSFLGGGALSRSGWGAEARAGEGWGGGGREAQTLTEPYGPLPFGNTRALLKIEDGCNMRCAFCIIPQTRGRQRSRPPAEVLAEARALTTAGHREIVVTGVQISAYRWEGHTLFDLVRLLLRESGAPRLRLTSIAPWDLDERLLGLWSATPSDTRLCRHLHLSLQSGSTSTLRRMHRPYTADAYARLLDRVRSAIPGVAVTTDVIAGFPGETDAEFAESLSFVSAAGFAKVHVFPFSPRPGTEAAGLPDPVHPSEIRERMERMLAAAAQAEIDFRRSALGRRETVLWERPRDRMGRMMGNGLTDNYIRVFSPEGAGLWNRFSEVELAELAEDGVQGRMVG